MSGLPIAIRERLEKSDYETIEITDLNILYFELIIGKKREY